MLIVLKAGTLQLGIGTAGTKHTGPELLTLLQCTGNSLLPRKSHQVQNVSSTTVVNPCTEQIHFLLFHYQTPIKLTIKYCKGFFKMQKEQSIGKETTVDLKCPKFYIWKADGK